MHRGAMVSHRMAAGRSSERSRFRERKHGSVDGWRVYNELARSLPVTEVKEEVDVGQSRRRSSTSVRRKECPDAMEGCEVGPVVVGEEKASRGGREEERSSLADVLRSC